MNLQDSILLGCSAFELYIWDGLEAHPTRVGDELEAHPTRVGDGG
ncbi:hypothetical protein [Microcoleus sp. herbarium12]